ncbi:hypothetical protein QOU54_31265, partial [Pseudomonas aeruginosa]
PGNTRKHESYNVCQRSYSSDWFSDVIYSLFTAAVANPWQALGNLRAQQDLERNSVHKRTVVPRGV